MTRRNEQGQPLLSNGEIDWELLDMENEALGKPEDVEAMKRRVADEADREMRGGSHMKPIRKHASNYTPPKKRNRRKK